MYKESKAFQFICFNDEICTLIVILLLKYFVLFKQADVSIAYIIFLFSNLFCFKIFLFCFSFDNKWSARKWYRGTLKFSEHTPECDLNTHECDFSTKSVFSHAGVWFSHAWHARVWFLHAECDFHTQIVYHTHECDFDILCVIFTPIRMDF
jgi:hypothetical protein